MRQLVEDTLREAGLHSAEAVELILGTIAVESDFGKYRKQLGSGPALGICQIEPSTFWDNINNHLNYSKALTAKIKAVAGVTEWRVEDLEYNDKLSILMCRVKYLRDPYAIPDDLHGQAEYWKRVYNTPLGKGTVDKFIEKYNKYVNK